MSAATVSALASGYYPELTLDTLVIPRFGDFWNDVLWSGLLRICSSYQVKDLVCLKDPSDETTLHFLKSFSQEGSFPLLSELQTITVTGSKIDTAVLPMIRKSKAYILNFKATKDGLESHVNDILDSIYRSMGTLGPRWTICQINILSGSVSCPLSHFKPQHAPLNYRGDPWVWTGVSVGAHRNCLSMLERNQKARDNCRKACLVVLGFYRKRLVKGLSKDSALLLAKAIWDSRGTHLWSRVDPPK